MLHRPTLCTTRASAGADYRRSSGAPIAASRSMPDLTDQARPSERLNQCPIRFVVWALDQPEGRAMALGAHDHEPLGMVVVDGVEEVVVGVRVLA
jgi:hypothetical protein